MSFVYSFLLKVLLMRNSHLQRSEGWKCSARIWWSLEIVWLW